MVEQTTDDRRRVGPQDVGTTGSDETPVAGIAEDGGLTQAHKDLQSVEEIEHGQAEK